MCQLLGMNCNTPTDVTFSFSGFAQRGGVTSVGVLQFMPSSWHMVISPGAKWFAAGPDAMRPARPAG
ncbi:MAG: class II glutamine amidotransferase, partial [Limnohabitans sp.]